MNTKIKKALLFGALFTLSAPSFATLIFDNGSVDPARTTWNDTSPNFTIYDDFTLNSNTTITGISHSIFMQGQSNYAQTYISIFDGVGVGANAVIAEFSVTGSLTLNGLSTSNGNVPTGFDVSISGLSLNLSSGTYFLGIRTDTTSGLASIGSGSGSAQTVGGGLFQAYGTSPATGGSFRSGDHMAFQLDGTSGDVSVPEPAILALVSIGLLGIGLSRRKNTI